MDRDRFRFLLACLAGISMGHIPDHEDLGGSHSQGRADFSANLHQLSGAVGAGTACFIHIVVAFHNGNLFRQLFFDRLLPAGVSWNLNHFLQLRFFQFRIAKKFYLVKEVFQA